MKTHTTIFKLALLVLLITICTQVAGQESAIYAGGPVYMQRNYAIDELRNSGFTTVIIWTIHIESNGNLGFNGEFPLVKNGVYVGNAHYPNFPNDVTQLKVAPTSINRVEFGLSGYGSGTFDAVRNFYNSEGFGPGTTLFKNFQALKNAIPGIDAFNNDDEGTYHTESAVAFTKMLAGFGFKNAIVPYTRSSFWSALVSQVNAAYPGNLDRTYLQVYAGGSGNNPCSTSWDFGIPVYPGMWGGPGHSSVSAVENKMNTWESNCNISGGFMWLYDAFDNSPYVAAYATAINNAFSSGGGSSNDHTDPVGSAIVTARAQIHNGEAKDMAIDNNTTTKWLDNGGTPSISNPSWIMIQLPEEALANKLTIVSANDAEDRDPQNFNIQGSNDGSSWITLGSWTGQNWSNRFQKREFTLTNSTPYKYYRINTTKNRGNVGMTQLAEIELIGPSNNEVDYTDPVGTGTVTARTQISNNENKNMAFDNLYTSGIQNSNWSKWLDNGGVPSTSNPSWIRIQFPTAKVVNKLAIVSANDVDGRDPQNFNIQGSNNGTSWNTLGSWTGQNWSSRFQKREFIFTNTTSYTYYRINTTKNRSNLSMTQLAEIMLIGPGSNKTSTINFEKKDVESVAIYPNPFTDYVKIDLSVGHTFSSAKIYTVLGQLIIDRKITPQDHSIELNSLKRNDRGMFLVVLEGENKRRTFKIYKK
ncbi:discoidin domain-containing protein [Aquimarina sediminis]|uniref:discoidin domain-containing protein n=1 Tax=Aquimarina sediminis TaxID=2070536 RepID=UPI000CA031E8|nr:discoidin domain-containing protein [Aquimarina sediminis]